MVIARRLRGLNTRFIVERTVGQGSLGRGSEAATGASDGDTSPQRMGTKEKGHEGDSLTLGSGFHSRDWFP